MAMRRMGNPLTAVFLAVMVMSSTLPSCYPADEGTCYDVMFCRGDVCKLRCRYLGYPDNAPCYCKSKPDGSAQCCCQRSSL
uniref:Knottin scorpion toxin-like domain-containing protein n=1 Tax=Oryza barthii TaxID=65489 RepID=A0A0D3F7G6_9ORYZ